MSGGGLGLMQQMAGGMTDMSQDLDQLTNLNLSSELISRKATTGTSQAMITQSKESVSSMANRANNHSSSLQSSWTTTSGGKLDQHT
jgi:hypothetical protein